MIFASKAAKTISISAYGSFGKSSRHNIGLSSFLTPTGLGILIKNENPELAAWLHEALETQLGAYYVSRGAGPGFHCRR